MKKTICLFIILTAISCNNKEETILDSESIVNKNISCELELIDSIPEKFDGCGEILSFDSIKGIAVKYLFLSNIQDTAMIKINGENIYLEKDTIKSKEIDSKNYIEYFKNKDIEAIVKLKLIEKYDEGGFYNGSLIIKRKGRSKTYNVKGESGC